MYIALPVVSNRWTGLWTGSLDWTELLDWILKKGVRLACKTACVVKTCASQGHTNVAEPRKRGARVTINLNKAINYATKLTKPVVAMSESPEVCQFSSTEAISQHCYNVSASN